MNPSHRRRLVATPVVLSGCILFGCVGVPVGSTVGGADASLDTSTDPEDSAPSIDGADARGLGSSLCGELTADYEAVFARCLPQGLRGLPEPYPEFRCAGIEDVVEAIARGWAVYDAAAMEACHARWRASETCDGEALTALISGAARAAIDACPGALVGQQPVGEPCRWDSDCPARARCLGGWGSGACTGTCEAALGLGERCDVRTPPCEPWLVCGARGVCVLPRCPGDPCDDSNPCVASWCDDRTGVCRTYVSAAAGEPCGDHVSCDDHLRCVYRGDGTRVCGMSSGVGEPCDIDFTTCAAGLWCRLLIAPSIQPNGVCVLRGDIGESCADVPCARGVRCLGELCAPPARVGEVCETPFSADCEGELVCADHVCLEGRVLGEPCGDGVGTCVRGLCGGGRCYPRAILGALCSDEDECLSRSCHLGRCVDTTSCLADNP